MRPTLKRAAAPLLDESSLYTTALVAYERAVATSAGPNPPHALECGVYLDALLRVLRGRAPAPEDVARGVQPWGTGLAPRCAALDLRTHLPATVEGALQTALLRAAEALDRLAYGLGVHAPNMTPVAAGGQSE